MNSKRIYILKSATFILNKSIIWVFLGCLLSIFSLNTLCHLAYCQEDSSINLEQMSLEDLLKIKITSAAKSTHTLEDSPAIMTLITSEEIQKSGARDLIDILERVPGISLASDTQGVISLGIRGNWATEGKVLLLMDGEELNEILYSTIQLGHHYPADSIQRIEIIRGPGSALYGGYAELAVINIITKGSQELNGIRASGQYGQTRGIYGHRNIGLQYGKSYEKWKVSASGWTGQATRSNRDYTDSHGSTFNLTHNSHLDPLFVNLGLSRNAWNLRLIYDRYQTTDRTAYGTNATSTVKLNFNSLLLGMKYDGEISSRLKLSPEFHIKQQTPWQCIDPECNSVTALYYNKKAHEFLGRLMASYSLSDSATLHAGTEIALYHARDYTHGSVFQNGKDHFNYARQAVLSELDWKTPLANLTLGARFDRQGSSGGSAFVPRFAAVKQWNNFHVKLLYSWGYRTPGIENIRINPQIKPERTRASEIDFGYRLSSNMFASVNFFHLMIQRPIIYDYSGTESYQNYDKTGSHGLEVDYRIQHQDTALNMSYSYYQANSIIADTYKVSSNSKALLGFPQHKLTGNLNLRIFDTSSFLNLSGTYFSSRYGYLWQPSLGSTALTKLNHIWLAHLFLDKRDTLIKGLDLGFGIYNIFNKTVYFVQPYDGGHPPIPSSSREYLAKATYRISL